MRINDDKRLSALLNRFEPEIRDSFLLAVNSTKSQLQINEIVRLLELGLIDDALSLASSIPLSVSTTVDFSFVQSGQSTSTMIASVISQPVFFDQTESLAVQAMRANRGKLIREFAISQREAVTETIVDGIRRGVNPLQQARNFRDSIGLTAHQTKSVNNFRNMLQTQDRQVLARQLRDRRFDPTVRAALNNKRPLTQRQINRMVERYRERMLKFRAETIGRTEALRAVHEANDISFNQAVDSGNLQRQDLEDTWIVVSDNKLRDSHSFMSGQRRDFGDPFLSGNGNRLRFPGDPQAPADDTVQCRCSRLTRFK